MNSKFNDEQIEAYAAAFREGDAIWCDGEWREVVKNEKNGDNRLTAYADGNIFVINDGQDGEYHSSDPYGFEEEGLNESPYRVTTLEHYELQGGERIVCLTSEFADLDIKFGEVFYVGINNNGTPSIVSEKGDEYIPRDFKLWGVIPRYEQVTKQQKEDSSETVEQKVTNSKPKSETTDIAQILYKRYKNNLKTLLQNDIIDALEQEDYPQVDELLKLMDELKKQS